MTPQGVLLETLIDALPDPPKVHGRANIFIASLAIDSRAVRPGALFVALRGQASDGHNYIGEAIARGAVAIVCERADPAVRNVTNVVVADSAQALSKIADAFYRSPSRGLTVAGVTGTNGKTTTTHMVAEIVSASGLSAGIIGTLGTSFAGTDEPQSNTTPLASELHAFLAQMRDAGIRVVAMEVSSHALALQRVADVRFAVGALTNVTRDHLDFHQTVEAYAAAKHELFELAERCVFNVDDRYGETWASEVRAKKPVLTYALDGQADLRATGIDLRTDGSSFRLDGSKFELHLPGKFNISNALCAIAIARSLGIADEASARGLAIVESVRGRMERISDGDIDVIVDYAHTPDALQNALAAIGEIARGRRIVVFGCGGDRDRGKRPEMGAIAAHHADFSYITSDNPRSEDPQTIIKEIVKGIGDAPHLVQSDRRAAIASAIADARPGDVILIAGKGHENYQIVGDEILPFDDAAEARKALAQRGGVRA
ncbi:MAG TPA: UDP-N-acetylmuramoyl-L-alanyl-D-glutamate--2,6-diaminopimelate ligase [Candidatus Rubrimentiphilum sp.]|nr:UDP-N-acetylmuramoyl-L-alanyl-D-glutamate--2,6-diaminopimelate ligase [Candidatus Rubrimentiphilum sp.]